ncbi:hypothetical protein Phum_PHUM404990 [Pediculus humanus corporis]|uniref:RPGRIP1 C-terminal domain-containing protein n=1 Tax=Pediculus humanus subsp. corporis TaxID=121224 RepID=E0VRV0_PEDHC|nr:uncharacterized protein Phum_PHUM404990 [Pediculus humanus corporis]EEB16106.1 hypothetical protein Phum_PHUM404990 [Pediculus humanus corporis]
MEPSKEFSRLVINEPDKRDNQEFLNSSDDTDNNDEKLDKKQPLVKKGDMQEYVEVPFSEFKRGQENTQSSNFYRSSILNSHSDNINKAIANYGKKPKTMKRKSIKDGKVIEISIISFQIDDTKDIWRRNSYSIIFADFIFLDVKGENTETPESRPIPKTSDEICEFNFRIEIVITDKHLQALNSVKYNLELDLIIFKIVTDTDLEDKDCEDIGFNRGPFSIDVRNMSNHSEIIGTLVVEISVSPELENIHFFKL